MEAEVDKMAEPKTESLLDRCFFLECKAGCQVKIEKETKDVAYCISRIGRNDQIQQKIDTIVKRRCEETDNDKADKLSGKRSFDNAPHSVIFEHTYQTCESRPESFGNKLELVLLGTAVDVHGRDPGGVVIVYGERFAGNLEFFGHGIARVEILLGQDGEPVDRLEGVVRFKTVFQTDFLEPSSDYGGVITAVRQFEMRFLIFCKQCTEHGMAFDAAQDAHADLELRLKSGEGVVFQQGVDRLDHLDVGVEIDPAMMHQNPGSGHIRDEGPSPGLVRLRDIRVAVNVEVALVPLLDLIIGAEFLPTLDITPCGFRQGIAAEPAIMYDFRNHCYRLQRIRASRDLRMVR